jgi:hypothetical protein
MLLAVGCSDRLDELESRQDYIFEIIRQRTLSPEKCAGYSDSRMTCVLNNEKCACAFEPDEVDKEAAILRAAVELRAKQLADEDAAVSQDEDE